MRRFTNILFCPLARRDNAAAFRRVRHLAEINGGTVTVLGVVPAPPRLQRILHGSAGQLSVRAHLIEEAETKLAGQYRDTEDLPVQRVVDEGNPASAIIERVLCRHHDLVVVTADDDARDTTTVRRLLRQCPAPVWVMRPTRAQTVRVLAAVNPAPDEAELNDTILDLASAMATLDGGELHVVHAWELYGESSLRSSAFLHEPAADLDQQLAETEATHREALDELLARHRDTGAPWQVHLVKGAPADTVPALAQRLRINLMVMGTVARSGLGGLLMGNTAEQLLDQVSCSLVAVKPPSFVAPVNPDGR